MPGMLRRNEKYFEEHEMAELVRFGINRFRLDYLKGRINEGFGDAFESYSAGVNGVLALAKLSTWLAVHSIGYGMRLRKVVYEETQTFDPTPAQMKEKNETIRLSMMEVQQDPPGQKNYLLIKRICAVLETAIQRVDADMLRSFDTLTPSLIVLAWAAFEVLCEDVLEKSMDMRPVWLGTLRGRGRRRRLPHWEAMDRRGNLKAVSANSRGPLKRENLSYRTISGIRDAYWVAFFRGSSDITRLLRCREIDTLFALRNIIVHTGGIADGIFLSRVKGIPRFASIRDGERLQFDFDLLKNPVRPVLRCGFRLLGIVSKWLSEHPDAEATI
jgi:hypothetical protein